MSKLAGTRRLTLVAAAVALIAAGAAAAADGLSTDAAAPANAVRGPGIDLAPELDTGVAIKAATSETEHWLGELDSGKYADSWSEAADVFKGDVTQGDWAAQATKMRELVGKLVMREQTAATYSTRLRGAPTGDYVTVAYLTKYEKVPMVAETLAVTKGPDGVWRVVGYNISKAPEFKE